MHETMSLVCLHHLAGWHTIKHCWQAGWRPGQDLSTDVINNLQKTNIKPKTLQRIRSHYTLKHMERLRRYLQSQQIDVMTILDPDYPPQLKEIAQAPWVLYLRGDRSLLATEMIAVVGSRRPTPYGMKTTRALVTGLVKQRLTIVSGMAYGIDATAHVTTLKEQGKTIAVLGSGIDVIYPRRNEQLYYDLVKDGLVLSEAPTGTAPLAALFPQRNRIISGLSKGCLVVEAAARSGSLITAQHSLEQNREVFAVPGPIDSPQSVGPLQLVQQGAKCVTRYQDIIEEFVGYEAAATCETMESLEQTALPVLDFCEEAIFEQVTTTPIDLGQLYESVADKLTFPQFHRAVLSLEIKGCVVSVPGQKVVRR